jgi:hypothetical protein
MYRLLMIPALSFALLATPADAHRSGCHRWHTCPSDHGTYSTVRPSASTPAATPQRVPTPTPQPVTQSLAVQPMATQELEEWRQEWFAYEDELREWCMKQSPLRFTACMEAQMQQYGLTSHFFTNLRKGIISNVDTRATVPVR